MSEFGCHHQVPKKSQRIFKIKYKKNKTGDDERRLDNKYPAFKGVRQGEENING